MALTANTMLRHGARALSKRIGIRPRRPLQSRSSAANNEASQPKSMTPEQSNPATENASLPPAPPPPAASTSTPPPPPVTTFFTHTRPATPSLITTILAPLAVPFRAYSRAQQSHPLRIQFFTACVIYFLGDLSTQFVMSPASPIAPPPALPDHSSKTVLDTSPVLHPEYRTYPPPTSSATASSNPQLSHTQQEPPKGFSAFLEVFYSPYRSARAVLIGAIASIPGYKWFLYLGANFNIAPSTYLSTRGAFLVSLALKITINQAVFTPLFNSYFFGMQSILTFPFQPPFSEEAARTALFGSPVDDQPKSSKAIKESETEAQNGWESIHLATARFFSADNAQAAWERIRDTVPTSWVNSCKFWPAVTAFSFTFVPVQHRNVFAGVLAIGWQTYLGVINQEAARREALEKSQ